MFARSGRNRKRFARSWSSNEKGPEDVCSKQHVLNSIPRIGPNNECVPHGQHSHTTKNDNSGLAGSTEETLKREYRPIDDTEIRNCQETSRTAVIKKVSPKRGRLTRMRETLPSAVTEPKKGLTMELRRRKRGHVQEEVTTVSDEHIEPQYGIETEHSSSYTAIVRQRRCTRKSQLKDMEKGTRNMSQSIPVRTRNW
ncbi:hypothetical protein Tcan_03199 [Toxocara canis]|uniref:Uncharacterized protein n=1 Tax=Toxocara canis TaxID=6265 RepID=A0A0B2W013_TOXCA|nr:hypothetical protein Tcan_03199 [Toxocara canis]